MTMSQPETELAPDSQPATELSGDPAFDFLLKREEAAEAA